MASTTLTWAGSGLGTKTGTTIGTFFDDLDTLVTSKAADATFFWQTAGKNSSATSPQWILFSPKNGSNRRIALIAWSSSPAANNTAILDTTPSASPLIYGVYFPNGSANTLSNLTAASGTVCGNDTGVIKAQSLGGLASLYGASYQHFYFDSAEAMWFAFQNPAAASVYAGAVGSICVDGSDNAVDAVLGTQGVTASFGTSTSPLPWQASTNLAGGTTGGLRTNYGSANRVYYNAWTPTGVWGAQTVSATDILTDVSTMKAWFVPIQLLGNTKGEGFALKLRQAGIGPATQGGLQVYNSTGPVVAARCVSATSTGQTQGNPWLTNFKI